MLIRFIPRYYSDDDGGGAGGSDQDQDGKVKASDILNRYGKNEEAALRLAELYADAQNTLYKIRERNRSLTRERDDLKAKVPQEGSVVLTKDDEAELAAYRALGKPEAVKQAIDAAASATTDLATLRREKLLARAADLVGFKPSVLTRLAGTLDIQIKGTDDKPLPVVVVDDKETALADYAAKEWEEFLPSLQSRAAQAPDINAGARSNGSSPAITDDERRAAQRRYSATF